MRNRMIKKEFWNSHRILSIAIPERLLFVGMWNMADDDGILKNSPLQIKATLFPVDSHITLRVIEEYIKNMIGVGLIVQNKDGSLLKIKKWKDHQRIDKPTPSRYKFIEEDINNSKSTPRTLQDDYTPKEHKGKEHKVTKRNINKIKETVQDKTIELFNSFYSIYKRKQDKKRAYTSFKNLTRSNQLLCIEGVKTYNKWIELNAIEKAMIKLPSTYIHSEAWMDELDLTVTSKPEKLEFKLDASGNAVIGYCSECGKNDFYDPYKVHSSDSNCCNSKLLNAKPNVKIIVDPNPEPEVTNNTFVKLSDIVNKYQ